MSIIVDGFISKAIDKFIESIPKVVREVNLKLTSTKQDIETSITAHLQSVKNWAEEITFLDTKKSKVTNNVYVDLDLYIYPRRVRMFEDEEIEIKPFNHIINNEEDHILLLGQPGSGKTTSMKYVCNQLFYNGDNLKNYKLPIVIKLREFNTIHRKENNFVFGVLNEILGIRLDATETKLNEDQIEVQYERLILQCLDSLSAIIILDGFDEIAFDNRKSIVFREIEKLSHYLENSKLIVTSRTADFAYSVEKLVSYEICSLNNYQIRILANRWLGNPDAADKFIAAINNSPFYDTAIRPLTIAHLCAIYERVGKIPEKPKTVYKKIVNLLLEEWDEQRQIKRASKYANFEIDRKFEFLCNIAYNLTISLQASLFTKRQIESIYNKIYLDYDLVKNEVKQVVAELESHTGLLVQAGYESYEFAHKSLQEYLTAEYIVKLPTLLDIRYINKIPNEIAIAIVISSNPSAYFVELLKKISDENVSYKFIVIFLNRLLLEKPDFNQNHDVMIAALKLYSFYLKSNIKDKLQLQLFMSDNLTSQFESFIDKILKHNTLRLFLDKYRVINTITSDNGGNILQLERKVDLRGLPQDLYCRESFIYAQSNADGIDYFDFIKK